MSYESDQFVKGVGLGMVDAILSMANHDIGEKFFYGTLGFCFEKSGYRFVGTVAGKVLGEVFLQRLKNLNIHVKASEITEDQYYNSLQEVELFGQDEGSYCEN